TLVAGAAVEMFPQRVRAEELTRVAGKAMKGRMHGFRYIGLDDGTIYRNRRTPQAPSHCNPLAGSCIEPSMLAAPRCRRGAGAASTLPPRRIDPMAVPPRQLSLLLSLLAAGCPFSASATWSIVACDPDGSCGVAVSTHNLAVGASVPSAQARVG